MNTPGIAGFIALVAAAFLLAGVFSWTPNTKPIAFADPQRAKKPLAGDVEEAPAKEFSFDQAINRPLFSQSRRPFEPKVAEPEPVETAPEVEETVHVEDMQRNLRVLGISAIGNAPGALIQNRDTEETRWYRLGETVGQWRVENIGADFVELLCAVRESEDCSYRLSLYVPPESQPDAE